MQQCINTVLFLGVISIIAAGCDCDDGVTRLAPTIEVNTCNPVNTDKDECVCTPQATKGCNLNYAEVPISFARPLDITISNPSGVELFLKEIKLSEDSDPAFSLPSDIPDMVLAGDKSILTVTFGPMVESEVSGTLLIFSDAANAEADTPIEIALTGSGKDLGQPDISIEPGECDYGDVGVGATAYCDLSLVNRGQLDLVIDQVGFEPGTSDIFQPASVLPVPVYLPAQAGVTVRMAATPDNTDSYAGSLFFDSNDPDTPHAQVPMNCTGAAVPTAVARVYSINGQLVSGDPPQISPLDDVELTGEDSSASSAGRTIVGYEWTMVSKPSESTVLLTTPDAEKTSFMFNSSGHNVRGIDVAGVFVVRLTVTDSEGLDSTNDARVTLSSVPGEDFHIQLAWAHDKADMDLHLIRNNGMPFSQDDCYYQNCKGANGLDWGSGNFNPHLDVDDTDGYGPENINIAGPANGNYKVAVHYYSPHSTTVVAPVNVKIFVRGGLRAEYSRQFTACNQFWEVANVEWPSSLVTPIDTVRMDTHGSCL